MFKIHKGKHYHLNGVLYWNDKMIDIVNDVMISEIEEDGTIWAMDKEGDEFEVLKEDLLPIKGA